MPTKEAELSAEHAVIFCADLPLSDEARAVLTREMLVLDYLDALIAGKVHIDAAQVLARLMAPRDGVWWAAQCVALSFGKTARPQEVQALRAAEKWVTEMTEDARYACFEAAQKARLGSPSNCVAMAAFLSGPSLAPRDQDPVPPAPDFSAKMVAGTVLASSLAVTVEESAVRLAAFLQQGKLLYAQAVGGRR